MHSVLRREFGPVDPGRYRGDPLDDLVGTILSQSTTDVNSSRAYAALRERFPRWEQVARARTASIAAAIRSGGLANSKARIIKGALNEIHRREGSYSLSVLDHLDDSQAIEYLTSIDGVGMKTASCVLLFALGRGAFPVDTHVYRVTRRLGWLAPTARIDRASDALRPCIPDALVLEMHLYLVWHGRRTCVAGRPRCGACSVRKWCSFQPADSAATGSTRSTRR